jgi:hypothetical protein
LSQVKLTLLAPAVRREGVLEINRDSRPIAFRDLEELLTEGGIEVDHVTLYRWVQRFTPLLIDAAEPVRHLAGYRWFVDETYVKGLRGLVLRVPGGRPAWARHRNQRVPIPARSANGAATDISHSLELTPQKSLTTRDTTRHQ